MQATQNNFLFNKPAETKQSEIDTMMLKNLPKNEYDVFKQTITNFKTASNEYAEQVLALERQFRQNTQPLTQMRSEFLKKIPDFWITAMANHQDLKSYLDDDDVMEFLKKYLIDFQIVYAVDGAKFGAENVAKYGKDGMVLMIAFKQNPAFSNQYITKAIGKRTQDGTDIAFCEGTKIEWTCEKLKTKLLGPVDDAECSDESDDCDINDAEIEAFSKSCGVNAGGENENLDNHFSFFGWWQMSCDELDGVNGFDENGTDKLSRAFVDDLWSMPIEWYEHDDEEASDSDDSDSDDSSDEEEEEDTKEEEML